MAITIGAARDPIKDRSAELFAINGNPVAHYAAIDVPCLAPPNDSTKMILHGFESGDWNGLISAPASETDSKIGEYRIGPPLVPEPNSISFTCYFTVTNWTKRSALPTPRPPVSPSSQANRP